MQNSLNPIKKENKCIQDDDFNKSKKKNEKLSNCIY